MRRIQDALADAFCLLKQAGTISPEKLDTIHRLVLFFQIRDALIYVKQKADAGELVDGGICHHLGKYCHENPVGDNDLLRADHRFYVLRSLWITWPKASPHPYTDFPVPHPNGGSPVKAYDFSLAYPKWGEGPYAELRYELLIHMLKKLGYEQE